MTDQEYTRILCDRIEIWKNKARQNIEKWGLQERNILLLCMTEELGELARASLKYDNLDGNCDEINSELDDLMALGIQLTLFLAGDRIRKRISEEKKK